MSCFSCQRVCISVYPDLRLTQLCQTTQPYLTILLQFSKTYRSYPTLGPFHTDGPIESLRQFFRRTRSDHQWLSMEQRMSTDMCPPLHISQSGEALYSFIKYKASCAWLRIPCPTVATQCCILYIVDATYRLHSAQTLHVLVKEIWPFIWTSLGQMYYLTE